MPAITLAAPSDDAAIRSLLARNPVPGRMTLAYLREPDYFAGSATLGPFQQTLVAKDDDAVTGLACRAVRPMFINGIAEDVGYLGQLRVDSSRRGQWFVSRGFDVLRELHADGRTPAYVTTIIDGNRQATGVLVTHRRGDTPHYRFVDRLHTLAFPSRRESSSDHVTQACDGDERELEEFLARAGSRRQFFPVIRAGDFGTPLLRDLRVSDFLVARKGGGIRAVCALWDQSAYKQTVVVGYAPSLGAMRPLYNLTARATGRPELPAPGSRLRTIHASFLCTMDDDLDAVLALLKSAAAAARKRGFDWLIAGLSGRDPLLSVARRLKPVEYCSDIYTVQWDDQTFHDRLDQRPAYLEPAIL